MPTSPVDSPPAAWRRLSAYLARHKYGWATAIAGIFFSTLLLLFVFNLIHPLTDDALPRGLNPVTRAEGQRQIVEILATMVGLTLLGNLLNRQSNALIARLAQDMLIDLRSDYYAGLMKQGMAFYRRHEIGELLSIGLNDAEAVSSFFMYDFSNLLNYAGQLVLSLAFMFALSWQLTLGSLLLTGVIYGLSLALIVPRSRRLAGWQARQLARVNALLNQNLAAVRDIQIFNQEARTRREFRAELERLGHLATSNRELALWNSAIFYTIGGLGLALIYGLGALGVIQNLFELGLLISFAAFFQQFISPVKALGSAAVDVQSMLVSAQRVFGLMNATPEIQDRPDALDLGMLTGHLRFEDAGFSYAPKDPQAWRLRGVNLEIRPGEKVAFVGGSGVGKSTLLYLAARFYDVTEGRVTIDGYDVRDLRLRALRRNFSLVGQNVILFQGTLANNIRFARPDADMRAVETAAEIGDVTEFVDDLEHGFQTDVGEMGQALSGGQRQRVSIARAALPDAPILLMDEPTSALDTHSEAIVMKALDRLSQGRTTLIITHRLGIVRNADKIVVMGKDSAGYGVILAVGTHDELLEASAEYVELVGRGGRKAILLPIGPRYDTTPALPTVTGLASALNAPVHLLDFGPLPLTGAAEDNFGVTLIPGQDVLVINAAHLERVAGAVRTLEGEGVRVEVIHPARHDCTWVEVTLEAIERTQASHLVAVDNVMIPLDQLRESIRQIRRKTAVEYILVNPMTSLGA